MFNQQLKYNLFIAMSSPTQLPKDQKVGLRKSIRALEENFQKILLSPVSHQTQKSDEIISQFIHTIKSITGKIHQNSFQKLIFLLGATGAGKSTLINYIATKGSNFYVYATDGDNALIKVKENSISQIGGKQPTTIFPVPFSLNQDTFLDCAGEGDTGLIIQIINSIIKCKISENVEQAKILIVSTFSSLGSENGYGHSFKMAIEKNAQFMGDIDEFKDNIGFVITRAPLAETAMQETLEKLIAIGNHAGMSCYKHIIGEIVAHKKVSLFCGPYNKKKGSDYVPPPWNQDQWNLITTTINQIPYKKISSKQFFKISTNQKIRQALKKALDIKIYKASQLIQETISNILPLRIFSVELERVAEFINCLMVGCETTLTEFFKILQWNNYLNPEFDQKQVEKLDEQIWFLHQFTDKMGNKQDQNEKSPRMNWSTRANLTSLLNNTYQEAHKIICSKQNYVFNKREEGLVWYSPVKLEIANVISQKVKQLKLKYKEQSQIKMLGEITSSKYYKDENKQQVQRTIQQAYNETEKQIESQPYQQWQAPTYEIYTQKVTKSRPIIRYRNQTYEESVVRMKKVPKVRYQQYYEAVKHQTRVMGFKGSPYYTNELRTRAVNYDDWEQQTIQVQKQRQVPYTDYESYQEDVQKVREKTPGHNVTKQRQVVRQVQVTKYRPKHIYRDFTIRILDQQKLHQDQTQCTNKIEALRQTIENQISKYPKGDNRKNYPKIQLEESGEEDQMCRDLLQKWLQAEYEAYFFQNPQNSLQQIPLKAILGQVCEKNQV